MDTKPLLYGLIGFFLGGLLVSVAATTFEKPEASGSRAGDSMSHMVSDLQDKSGDAYDRAFLEHMIGHHQSAVDMSELSAKNAKHPEIKQLSRDITAAQKQEIEQMRAWQKEWGYPVRADHMHDDDARMMH